ncbi:flavin reductase family protein [Pseudofrankia inefficax]|uniref:Flavin reductase domain protein FMN-binding protein n=1 Tax=Pseudofrankia inefficax (strain DSM 45817 / CECT 9037 / DDB 130130 / EuI1c) TaxID=298654 RepID=E3IV55_PSEI1|nr:flavin reductase family protein [Pseudofrankia inefficax]ADP80075.1 flavin reductase domain protein FMN-binding protein [Pseudofrankia inefficax]
MTVSQATGPITDASLFTAVLSHFASGITVISSTSDGRPVGLTCQSFFSLSLDPPMVAFSVARTSTSFAAIRRAGDFVVNVLSAEQRDVSSAMARSGTDKWADVRWERGTITGHPVIEETLAYLECRIAAEYDGGDHVIVTAHVLGLGHATHETARPLLFYRSSYHGLADHARA